MLRADHAIAAPAKKSQPGRKRNLEALALLGLGLALVPALTFWGVVGYPVSLIDFRLRQLGFSEEAGIQRCQSCNLQDADLRSLPLQGARLQSARLERANLRGADLKRAELGGANLEGADLRGADLSNAGLGGANLAGADLRGAQLAAAVTYGGGVSLRHARIDGKTRLTPGLRAAWALESGQPAGVLRGIALSGGYLAGCDLKGRDLRGCILPHSILVGSDLRDADLRQAQFARDYSTAVRAARIGSIYDAHTRWPAGFQPEQHGLRRVPHDWKPEPPKGR
jgi:uncharacterized protein YjbI with pentapeptide repeats